MVLIPIQFRVYAILTKWYQCSGCFLCKRNHYFLLWVVKIVKQSPDFSQCLVSINKEKSAFPSGPLTTDPLDLQPNLYILKGNNGTTWRMMRFTTEPVQEALPVNHHGTHCVKGGLALAVFHHPHVNHLFGARTCGVVLSVKQHNKSLHKTCTLIS